jgi:tetratricopeptide (TPR) repeat protein
MSHINEALKKAQRDRDSRYERFSGIIASRPGDKRKSGRWKIIIGTIVALLLLIPAGLLTFHALSRPTPVRQETAPRAAAGTTEGKMPVAVPQIASNIPEQAGKAPALGRTAWETRHEAEARFREALAAQKAGDLRRAEELYQRTLLLAPDHLRTLNNLGVLYMDRKNKQQAALLFNRAIGLKKDYVDPYYNLACLHARDDEIDESLRYLKMAAAINPEVTQWAKKDADMKNVVNSEQFKKIGEGK